MNDLIRDKLALLPDTPGVYKMLDAFGTVIYVGKAVSLKRRVSQYFQKNRDHTPKVLAMVSHIEDFETIEVSNETEALSLESNLIKEFMPKYNILLKDDKHFPYVRINMRADYPRLEIVRRVQNDGAEYVGPFLSAVELRDQLSIIRNEFPIRHCRKDINRAIAARERPCLMHHLGKCCAPCSGQVTPEEYHAQLNDVISFLNGNTAPVIQKLKAAMLEASEKEDYEQAALLRDRIRSLEKLKEKQAVIFPRQYAADVFCPSRAEGRCLVFALYVRNGKVIGTEPYEVIAAKEDSDGEILRAFLLQHYEAGRNLSPPDILLSSLPEDAEDVLTLLNSVSERAVHLSVPQRGLKKQLVELARENGTDLLKKQRQLLERSWEREQKACADLAQIIGLESIPVRLECFDNSHIAGTDTVASMVVFTDGKPNKQEYRRYRIKSEAGGDDLLSMHEVLTRRLEKGEPWPDLIIVDGGKTQLQVALNVLEEQQLACLPVIALAESHELIYVPGEEEPVILPENSPVLHLLERIRDEAHRFAIEYHRSLRSKRALLSVLDNIRGIGDARKRALFDAFLTVDAIKAASSDALCKVKGMNRSAADAVWNYFHTQESKTENGGLFACPPAEENEPPVKS